MSGATAAPLTLATTRIVYKTGNANEADRVTDGATVARLIGAAGVTPGDLFGPGTLARQVANAAGMLNLLADDARGDTACALYFLAEALAEIARRLDVMEVSESPHYHIEPAGDAR